MQGASTQPAAAPTGMAYGAHAESVAAQRAVPLPAASPVAPQPPAPGPGGGAVNPFAAALQAAEAHPSPAGSFAMPSLRPDEPVTSGLPSGPGSGPEALAISQPGIASAFERLAYSTGDPDMAVLAQIAGGYGV